MPDILLALTDKLKTFEAVFLKTLQTSTRIGMKEKKVFTPKNRVSSVNRVTICRVCSIDCALLPSSFRYSSKFLGAWPSPKVSQRSALIWIVFFSSAPERSSRAIAFLRFFSRLAKAANWYASTDPSFSNVFFRLVLNDWIRSIAAPSRAATSPKGWTEPPSLQSS